MTEKKTHAELNPEAIRQIWSMLPHKFKGVAIRLWLLMVIGALLEMLGVSLVIPVVAVLTQPDILSQHESLNNLYHQLGQPGQQTLVIIMMLLLLTVYLLKNLYLGFLAWKQSKFIYGLQHDLSTRLFAIYLRQPYGFHLQRNSAYLIRNLQGEMAMFINAAVTPCISILAELLVVLGLFGMMLLIEPIGSIAVFGVLLIAGMGFQKVTKSRVSLWGKQRITHEGSRIKQLHHGLGGVKDVKLFGREADFLHKYNFHTQLSMRMNQRQSVMQQLPRLWLELLAISALAVLLISMTMQGKSMMDILPTLVLFAAVSFRLMPSANRILGGIQQLRFGLPVVDMLHHELNLETETQSANAEPILFKDLLVLDQVSYTYPAAKKAALQDISLHIRKGEMIGFIGESGSGKSTLIDTLLGLLKPNTGQVLVDGVDIHNNLRSWQNQIGYVPQSIYLTDDTLRRNVAFGLAEEDIDDTAVKHALESAQLKVFVESLSEGVNTIVGERGVRLSGGQKQRIGIARALYHDPSVLVLDEATSALDMETEGEFMMTIDRLHGQKTIVIVAHRLSTIEKCDRVFQMGNGKIIGNELPLTSNNIGG